jgi:hypothetical protein
MYDIETIVFSRIKAEMPSQITESYSNLNFTTSSKNPAKARFPCVYVHMLSSAETGMVLTGNDIEAVTAGFQIEVTDNQSQARTKEVAVAIAKIMKNMGFQALGMPMNDNTTSTYRNVARYRRKIGTDDIL